MKALAQMALTPGMTLGEDVIDNGNVLIPADTVLNEGLIELLKRYSIMCVTVKEDADLAKTHNEMIRLSDGFKSFAQKHADNLQIYKKLCTSLVKSGTAIPDEALMAIYNDISTTYGNGIELLSFLYNLMPNEDELTFNHCLNSALLGGTFADWINMTPEDKKTLILSCFYYDIGKLRLPYELLWKPGKLSDEEYNEVKKHPVIGYALLNSVSIDQHIKNVVIMHHERMDGSGYPYHMKGTHIDLFARYVAIIDTYTAMASPRAYRLARTPLQIIGHFEANMPQYDTELLLPLMQRIADAQIGTTVQLSDDTVWNIFLIHPGRLSRPVLKNEKNEFLDLVENPQLEIVKNL